MSFKDMAMILLWKERKKIIFFKSKVFYPLFFNKNMYHLSQKWENQIHAMHDKGKTGGKKLVGGVKNF